MEHLFFSTKSLKNEVNKTSKETVLLLVNRYHRLQNVGSSWRAGQDLMKNIYTRTQLEDAFSSFLLDKCSPRRSLIPLQFRTLTARWKRSQVYVCIGLSHVLAPNKMRLKLVYWLLEYCFSIYDFQSTF